MNLSIDELAQQAGVTRRAVRFYVQQRLLPSPTGLGRGSHYDRSHLDRLKQIAQLQQSGHSLDAIRRILQGESPAPEPTHAARPVQQAVLTAELLTRLTLADGVELQFDASRYQPRVEGLLALRQLVQQVFMESDNSTQQGAEHGMHQSEDEKSG